MTNPPVPFRAVAVPCGLEEQHTCQLMVALITLRQREPKFRDGILARVSCKDGVFSCYSSVKIPLYNAMLQMHRFRPGYLQNPYCFDSNSCICPQVYPTMPVAGKASWARAPTDAEIMLVTSWPIFPQAPPTSTPPSPAKALSGRVMGKISCLL